MDNERLKILGMNIKIARLKAKISQEFLAEKIGVSRETISMIENGNQNTSALNIIDIIRILGASYEEIFKEV